MSKPTNQQISKSAIGNRKSAIGNAEELRRRLGTLDPQQVAIWRQMTPARKATLAFQMYYFARLVIWTTERQTNPDASPEELAWRMLRRLHGRALCSSLQAQMKSPIF